MEAATAECTHCGKPKEIDHETIDPRYPMVRCLSGDEIVIRPGIRGDGAKIVAERRERRRRIAHERHSTVGRVVKSCKLCPRVGKAGA